MKITSRKLLVAWGLLLCLISMKAFISCVADSPSEIVASNFPETMITSSPPNPSTSRDATFQFSCDQTGCSFECKLDSRGWTACVSPQNYTSLSLGPHTFQVRARSSSGALDPTPAAYTWTIGEPGKVVAVKVDPETGMVQDQQIFFRATCTTEAGLSFDCTESPNASFSFGEDLIPCPPPAPNNNCFQMNHMGISGNCSTGTHGCSSLQKSFVHVTYANPPEFGGALLQDEAEVHCRQLVGSPVFSSTGLTEGQALHALCSYTDCTSYNCDVDGFVSWTVTAGSQFADTATVLNVHKLSAAHIPGPCGAAIEVQAAYTDGLRSKVWSGILPIDNDDHLMTLSNIGANPALMDYLRLFDATCGYDLAGSGHPDPEGAFNCSDVYVHNMNILNPPSVLPKNAALFATDPLNAAYCIDAFDADWTWEFPVDDCSHAYLGWPPFVRLPQPNQGAWTGMFAGGICGMSPPENYAYANYAYYTDRDNAPTLISGQSSANITLNFIDHTLADWLTTTATIAINGGFYVNDPIWHPTEGMHRPAIHSVTADGANWVSFYTEAGTCNVDNPLDKCAQVIRIRCQDFSTGAWSQCVDNAVSILPIDQWYTLRNYEWDFIVLADPNNYLMKDNGEGMYLNGNLTLAEGWAKYMNGRPNRPLDASGAFYSFNEIVLRSDAAPPGGAGTCDTTNFMIVMITHNPWYLYFTEFESMPGVFAYFELCELP